MKQNAVAVLNINAFDADDDGISNNSDNCSTISNPDQANSDGDSEGNACDADDDNDGYSDETENALAAAIAAGESTLNLQKSNLATLVAGKAAVLAQYNSLKESASAQLALSNQTQTTYQTVNTQLASAQTLYNQRRYEGVSKKILKILNTQLKTLKKQLSNISKPKEIS